MRVEARHAGFNDDACEYLELNTTASVDVVFEGENVGIESSLIAQDLTLTVDGSNAGKDATIVVAGCV